MSTANNNYSPRIQEWQPLLPASRALSAIWLTGMACAIVIVVYILRPGNHSGNYGGIRLSQPSAGGIHSIDELLLASDEPVLAEDKSFVNGNLRIQWRSQGGDFNQDASRRFLYDNILKRKLQRVPQSKEPDFSIRPVPK